MKSIFGNPPEDGYISCKICGEYLCDEDTTLFDSYEGDKPMRIRESIPDDESNKLEILKSLSDNDDIVTYIKLIGSSLGVSLENNDIYDIIQSYKYLDHNLLPDIRYNPLNS